MQDWELAQAKGSHGGNKRQPAEAIFAVVNYTLLIAASLSAVFYVQARPALAAAAIEPAAPVAPILMPPFKAFAEMVVLQPVRATKDKDSPIFTLWVKDVLKDSSAYKAGLRKGMFVSRIQDMAVKGLSEKQLVEATAKLRVTDGVFVVKASRTVRGEANLVFNVALPKARISK